MTTVTEAAKRLFREGDEESLREGDLGKICSDVALAQRFARRLAEAARELSPGRHWSAEELRDVLEVAVRGVRHDHAQVLEGRYFRKRLREQCALAERYGDPFACVVITLEPGLRSEGYQSVLDAVTEGLRRSDMIFLYRRRFALVLPRMRVEALEPMIGRLQKLVAVGVGEEALESIASLVFPNERVTDTRGVLEWGEDQLREV